MTTNPLNINYETMATILTSELTKRFKDCRVGYYEHITSKLDPVYSFSKFKHDTEITAAVDKVHVTIADGKTTVEVVTRKNHVIEVKL